MAKLATCVMTILGINREFVASTKKNKIRICVNTKQRKVLRSKGMHALSRDLFVKIFKM